MNTCLTFIRNTTIFASIFFFLLLNSVAAKTYYVAPTGSDGASGTSSAPFRSIQKAADIVKAGDTVIVRDGVYTDTNRDDYVVRIRAYGTPSSWITFRSENRHGAIIDGSNYTTTYGVFFKAGSEYVKFENFEIRGAKSKAIIVDDNATDWSHDVHILDNKIHDIGRYGKPCGEHQYGIAGIFTAARVYDVTIEGNLFHDIGRLSGYCEEHDYKHDHGCYLQGYGHVVQNNVFYHMYAGWGVKVDGHYDTVKTTNRSHIITNNTFAFAANPVASGHIRFYSNSGLNVPENVLVQNNIFYQPTGTSAIRISGGGWPWSGTIIRNNLTTSRYMYYEYDNAIAKYVTASGNMVSTDPGLRGPDNKDFRLSPGSEAISAGTSQSAPSYDFDDNSRLDGSGHDIGAYVYNGSGQVTSPPQCLRIVN